MTINTYLRRVETKAKDVVAAHRQVKLNRAKGYSDRVRHWQAMGECAADALSAALEDKPK